MENHVIPVTMAKKIWNLVRVFLVMARKGISNKRKLLLDLNLLLKRGKLAGKALVGNLLFHYHHLHRNHNHHPNKTSSLSAQAEAAGEYEFSCSNTPSRSHSHVQLHHHMMNLLQHLHVGSKISTTTSTIKQQEKKKKSNDNNKKKNKGHVDVEVEDDIKRPDLFFDDEHYEAVTRVLDVMMLLDQDQQQQAGGISSGNIELMMSLEMAAAAAAGATSCYASPAYSFSGSNSPMVRQLRVTDSPFPLPSTGCAAAGEEESRVDEAADEFIKRFYSQLRQQRLMMSPAPSSYNN